LKIWKNWGFSHQAYPHIGTTDEAQSSALFQFHQKMIEHGKRSLKKSSKQRDVTSLTMSLNEDQYHFIKKKVREVYQDIQKHISKGDGKKPTSVYQMNVQIFDFLKPLGEKL
jgi:uncharacterized protein (TIGR02147 family)